MTRLNQSRPVLETILRGPDPTLALYRSTTRSIANPVVAKPVVALATALLLTACASTSGSVPLTAASDSTEASVAATPLTASEMKLDCKAITGRMQVRILQIRDFTEREQTTGLARSLQGATATVLGGTKVGTDPQAYYNRERVKLEALNARLAEKGCPTFDLDNELKPKPISVTPLPVRQ